MQILNNQTRIATPRVATSPAPSTVSSSTTQKDTFTRAAKVAAGTGIGAAVGFGLGSAAAMGGFGGGTVGALAGVVTGALIASRFGDGKGAEGLLYPVAGAAIGGIGGAVLGAIGGDHVGWIGAAAGGLALLQAMR